MQAAGCRRAAADGGYRPIGAEQGTQQNVTQQVLYEGVWKRSRAFSLPCIVLQDPPSSSAMAKLLHGAPQIPVLSGRQVHQSPMLLHLTPHRASKSRALRVQRSTCWTWEAAATDLARKLWHSLSVKRCHSALQQTLWGLREKLLDEKTGQKELRSKAKVLRNGLPQTSLAA